MINFSLQTTKKEDHTTNLFLHTSFQITDSVSFINFVDLKEEAIFKVLDWRNHPIIRKWMYQKEIISTSEHIAFMEQLPQQFNKFYWVVRDGETDLGVIDIVKYDQNDCEWGFYLNPNMIGSGKAITLIHHALDFFFKTLKIKALYGFCDCENTSALLLHDLFGIRHSQYVPMKFASGKHWYSKRIINAEDWLKQQATITDIEQKKKKAEPFLQQQKKLLELNQAVLFIHESIPPYYSKKLKFPDIHKN